MDELDEHALELSQWQILGDSKVVIVGRGGCKGGIFHGFLDYHNSLFTTTSNGKLFKLFI